MSAPSLHRESVDSLIVPTLLLPIIWLCMPHLQHYLALWTHSCHLPDSGPPFIGREKELTTWVDLQSNNVKVVGPTGIGKSALAIEVDNQMRDKGATVSYGDVSVLSINNLPNQNLQSAGIFTLENSSQ